MSICPSLVRPGAARLIEFFRPLGDVGEVGDEFGGLGLVPVVRGGHAAEEGVDGHVAGRGAWMRGARFVALIFSQTVISILIITRNICCNLSGES